MDCDSGKTSFSSTESAMTQIEPNMLTFKTILGKLSFDQNGIVTKARANAGSGSGSGLGRARAAWGSAYPCLGCSCGGMGRQSPMYG